MRLDEERKRWKEKRGIQWKLKSQEKTIEAHSFVFDERNPPDNPNNTPQAKRLGTELKPHSSFVYRLLDRINHIPRATTSIMVIHTNPTHELMYLFTCIHRAPHLGLCPGRRGMMCMYLYRMFIFV